jgi:hypothetical protein
MNTKEWTVEQWVEHGRAWLRAGWTWAPGQIAIEPIEGGDGDVHNIIVSWTVDPGADAVPDMRDPGTRGHALDQVRDACDDPTISVNAGRHGDWLVAARNHEFPKGFVLTWYSTEHEALLAAREAAPDHGGTDHE